MTWLDLENKASALAFVECNKDLITNLGIYNYYPTNYGLEKVMFQIFRADTQDLLFEFESTENRLFIFELNKYLEDYKGNIYIIVKSLGQEAILQPLFQVFTEFKFKNGFISTIHGQGHLTENEDYREYHNFDLEKEYIDIELLLQNHNISNKCISTIEVFNEEGKSISDKYTFETSPLQVTPVRLLDIINNLENKLKTKRAVIKLSQSVDSRRPPYKTYIGEHYIINHGSVSPLSKPGKKVLEPVESISDDDKPAYRDDHYTELEPFNKTPNFIGRICCALPIGYKNCYDISFLMDNFMSPINEYYVDLYIFDNKGNYKSSLKKYIKISKHGIVSFNEDNVKSLLEVEDSFYGHAIIAVHENDNNQIPELVQFNLSSYVNNNKTGSCMIGGWEQNTASKPGERGRGFRRNKTYSPIVINETTNTDIYFCNNSSLLDYNYDAKYKLIIRDSLNNIFEGEYEIKANQMMKISIKDFVNNIKDTKLFRDTELGWIEIRSLEAQMPGFYVIYDEGNGFADIEHMFGA